MPTKSTPSPLATKEAETSPARGQLLPIRPARVSQASLPSASTQTPTPLAGTQTGSTTLRRGAGGRCLESLISESGRQGTAGGERLLIPPLAVQLRLLSITHRTDPGGGETGVPARSQDRAVHFLVPVCSLQPGLGGARGDAVGVTKSPQDSQLSPPEDQETSSQARQKPSAGSAPI